MHRAHTIRIKEVVVIIRLTTIMYLKTFFNAIPLIPLILFISIIILILLPTPTIATQLRQSSKSSGIGSFPINQYMHVSPMITPSPTTSGSSASSQDTSPQSQVISEAQNDISIANLIIAWSGFFLAFIATTATVAGIFGVRELRRIRQLGNEFQEKIQEVNRLKKQVEEDLEILAQRFENESQTFMEASYNFSLATNAYKLGDNEHAIEYYLRVAQLQPKNIQVIERLGRTYDNMGDKKKAIHYLENALSINSSYIPALRSLGLCYRYTDQAKAIESYKHVLEVDPSDNITLDFLGLIYRDQGKIDDAILIHEQALSIKKRPETEFFLGILYAQKGDIKRAKLMLLSSEDDLHKKEHDERIRTAWKILIQASVPIIEGNEGQAFQLIRTLSPYIASQSLFDELTTHLTLLLNATNHKEWTSNFIKSINLTKK